jgi:hypothetical protein
MADGARGRQLDFLPPSLPAAAFCARLPPLPLPLLLLLRLLPLLPLLPLPEFLPPFLDAPGVLAIAAARPLLMPFSRSPSYCLSFLTLGPWSLAMLVSFRSTFQSFGQLLLALLGTFALSVGARFHLLAPDRRCLAQDVPALVAQNRQCAAGTGRSVPRDWSAADPVFCLQPRFRVVDELSHSACCTHDHPVALQRGRSGRAEARIERKIGHMSAMERTHGLSIMDA